MFGAQLKALSLLLGGTAVVGTAAYVSGALDRFLDAPVQQAAVQKSEPVPLMAKQDPAAIVTQPSAKPPAIQQPANVQPPAATPGAAARAEVVAPSFDIVRAEPDGSLVIAGKAAPGSAVEIVSGSKVLGTATASPEGDFAVVLDDRLPPGDYQIVLRATGEDKIAATSIETAIVSIPDRTDGQVLALVEQPGQPSRLITLPEAEPAPAQSAPASGDVPKPADATGEPIQDPAQSAAAPAAEKPAAAAQPAAAPPAQVLVKAVEIEGNRVFVAGVAPAGSVVRVFANDILLGEAKASPNGEFLVETIRDLAVGDYIVRADLIARNGRDVAARAQVPFRRLEGESVAAVAPGVVTPSSSAVGAAKTAETGPAKPAVATDAGTSPAGHAAEPLEAAANGVIIRRGDTLWRISKRVYGRGVRYSTIYLANQEQISDPNRIWPGQVFSVPGKTSEGEDADMDAIADQKAPKS